MDRETEKHTSRRNTKVSLLAHVFLVVASFFALTKFLLFRGSFLHDADVSSVRFWAVRSRKKRRSEREATQRKVVCAVKEVGGKRGYKRMQKSHKAKHAFAAICSRASEFECVPLGRGYDNVGALRASLAR